MSKLITDVEVSKQKTLTGIFWTENETDRIIRISDLIDSLTIRELRALKNRINMSIRVRIDNSRGLRKCKDAMQCRD